MRGRYGDFWSKVEKTETCWLWCGAHGPHYGTVRFKNRHYVTHRVSWEMANGPIPDGLKVLHRCDVPLCVRPDHLFLGTQADNMADASMKGRLPDRSGSRNPRAKLTDAEVAQLRVLYKEGARQIDLAAQFGIKQPQVSRIVRSAQWQTG